VGEPLGHHPALGNAWAEFVPFLPFDREIRAVICTTNTIESINAQYRAIVTGFLSLPMTAC
jgi:transposase-like protein